MNRRHRRMLLSVAGIAAALVVAPSVSTSARSSIASMQNTTAPPLREAYAALPGVRLWYVDSGGGGVPVIFMHAATGSVRSWEYQVPAFTKAGYRFIAFDRRGWGRTTIDAAGSQPGTAADDLEGLRKHLGIDRFHLVGTAAGGFVAFDYALSFKTHLRSLVVANSIGGVQDEEYLELGRALRPSPQFEALPPDFRELGPTYRAGNREGARRWVELQRMSRPEGPPAAAQPMRNRVTFAVIETLDLPTLLLTGDADFYEPPAILELFARRIKGAKSFVAPGAGHSTYWEQPDVFNRQVLEFIRGH